MLINASRAGDDTPRSLADRNGFDHLERCDIDHRDVVADPVRRVDPALIRVEGQAPYPLSDQQILQDFIALHVDDGNAVGGAEPDKGDLAVARDRDPDRLDRLGRYPGDRKGDAPDDVALSGVDNADRSTDFGGNPELRAVGGPYRAPRATVDEDVGDDLACGGVD